MLIFLCPKEKAVAFFLIFLSTERRMPVFVIVKKLQNSDLLGNQIQKKAKPNKTKLPHLMPDKAIISYRKKIAQVVYYMTLGFSLM